MDPNSGFSFVATRRHDTYALVDPLKADLSGKFVLVTGASKGIGKATAVAFAKAGASGIAVLARSDLSSVEEEILKAAKQAGRAPPKVLRLAGDTTDRAVVEKAASAVNSAFGQIDILINNAGVLEPYGPLAESHPDLWWRTFEVNVKGVYLVTRSFLPIVLKSQQKTIIAMSSIGAQITSPGMSSYQSTKQTVLRLNDFLMAEYGDQGLLAYGIHPGGVLTDMGKSLPTAYHAVMTDTPELAADTLVFLTKEKRDWLADRYVDVCWDMSEFLAKKDEIVQRDLLKTRLRL